MSRVAPRRDARQVTNGSELGRALIERVARRDLAGAAELLSDPLNFRGLTPGSFREAATPAEAIAILEKWFYEDDDVIRSVEWCDARPVGRDGRFKISYGYRAKSPGMQEWYDDHGLEGPSADGDWIVEQEAYYDVTDGRISWMIVLCGGYHPVYQCRR